MPTGYTAELHDGSQSFEDYALGVARAFGALITMRDEPNDAEIPEQFEPSSYHQDAIAEAHKERDRFLAMSDADVAEHQDNEREKAFAHRDEYVREKDARRRRYEAMLEKARAYEPPTPDHKGFKEMMVSQLEESIRFDCGDYEPSVPDELLVSEYRAQRVAQAERDIRYHQGQYAKDVRRAEERTGWVRELRRSLAVPSQQQTTP